MGCENVTQIAVVSDTHCYTWEELHPSIRECISTADIAVHCGDFTRMDVVHGISKHSRKAVLVSGNSDPIEIREALPYTQIIEVQGISIGVIHPVWGGPEFPAEELLQDFTKQLDIVLFGHLHETLNEVRNGVLFVNPGQGYSSFKVPATMATLTIQNGHAIADIILIEPGR